MIDSLGCGGAEKSLVSLLPLLDYSKIDVTLLMVARGGIFECYVPKEVKMVGFEWPSTLKYKFAHICYAFKHRYYSMINKVIYPAMSMWHSVGWALPTYKEEYDYAFAYQQGFPTYYIANKVKAKRKFSWANIDMKAANHDVKYDSMTYNAFDRVIAVSDAVYEGLLKDKYVKNPSKVVTIYDILNPQLIQRMSQEKGFTDDYKGLRFVTCGRIVDQKGYDMAVLAANELRKRGHNFKWYFVGDGTDKPLVEALIKEKELEDYVKLLGVKVNPYPYMKECDIYVQTSRFEGFGLTVTEARILGKAEVCTNFPSAYNQITDGVNGLICNMTPEDIADKIEMLIENPDLKAKLESNVAKERNMTAVTESAKVKELLKL